jgi:zinc-binding alcohol dehydrogenase/oxidoreductase
MQAAVVNVDLSLPPVAVRTVDMPALRPYWALVRVHHAALNRLDAMMIANRSDQPPGAVFGSDGAGVVVELGPAFTPALPQVPGVAVGAEVVISPSLLWGADPTAPGERYEILGSPTRGTHAEYVTVPAANLFPRPAHLSWAEAAALPTAGVTAWRALVTRDRLTGDDTVVIGAGSSGVGTLAIQIASATGARVVAVTSTPDKAAHALKLGAHATVDRTAGPDELASALREQTDDGASLALDPTCERKSLCADSGNAARRVLEACCADVVRHRARRSSSSGRPGIRLLQVEDDLADPVRVVEPGIGGGDVREGVDRVDERGPAADPGSPPRCG